MHLYDSVHIYIFTLLIYFVNLKKSTLHHPSSASLKRAGRASSEKRAIRFAGNVSWNFDEFLETWAFLFWMPSETCSNCGKSSTSHKSTSNPEASMAASPLSCSQKYPIALPQMSGATCHHSSGFASHFGWSELAMKKSILGRIWTWKKKSTHKTQESKIFGFKVQIKKKVERRNAKLVKVSVVIFHRNDRFVSFHSCLEDGGESDGNFDDRLRNAKNLLLGWGSRPYLMLGLKQPVGYISGWCVFHQPIWKICTSQIGSFP